MKTENGLEERKNTTDGSELITVGKASHDTKGSSWGGWDGGFGWIP